MANLHRILGQPPYRLVESGKGVFRFRVGDYEGGHLQLPMEGIVRVFGQGTVSEIDSDIQRIGRPPLLLVVLAIVLAWTLVVPLFIWWWVRRAPRRAMDRILSA
jgi:hypothetical protein